MASVLSISTIFLHLLILGTIHGNLAREVPKTTEDDHLCLNHGGGGHGCNPMEMSHDMHLHTSSSSSSHIKLSWHILFYIEDLKLGKKIPLYFSVRNSTQFTHLIPKQEADSIPFSSSETAKILEFFSFHEDSPQAKAIKQTLNHCELPPLEGETKFCATSLESMLEKLTLLFGGQGSHFRVLTTTQVKNWTPHLQNYTLLEEPKEISVEKMFGCHPMPYPYAVFYCHGQDSDNRLFMLSLEGEDGLRLEALAICHMDTSHWDPNHVSFRVLGLEPGTAPVCHVFPQDNLVWASSPSSGN